MKCSFVILAATLLCAPTVADELCVPDPYPTIQAAIDAASDGDVVLVAPGTYDENIDFLGKPIRVASTDGAAATIIRGLLEDQSVVVIMWRATHFSVTSTLVNNIVAYNFSWGDGGGISLHGEPDAFIDARLINNTIFGNDTMYDDIFVEGIFCGQNSSATIVNSIVWDNDMAGVLDVSYSDVEGGWSGEGNIDLDPRLAGPAGDDFHLRMDSPCVDTGTGVVAGAPTVDYEGDERPADGDMDTVAEMDMGADECRPDHAVLFGTVNIGAGPLAEVLFLNGGAGGDRRTVTVESDGPMLLEIALPPATPRPACRHVIHVDVGSPVPETMTLLPEGVGWTAFPFLLGDGAAPAAVFNCLGWESTVGPSTYFDGAPIPDPPRAPAIVLDLPSGDPSNLPPGTVITFQGIIVDWGTAAAKRVSVSNGIVAQVE